MTEREKIYKGLAACTGVYAVCKDCPYREQRRCQHLLMDDALNLLKEQETKIRQLRLALDIARQNQDKMSIK